MAAQRRRADDVEDCEYDADDVGEREREKKNLCTAPPRSRWRIGAPIVPKTIRMIRVCGEKNLSETEFP